jgi:hypothetical protein
LIISSHVDLFTNQSVTLSRIHSCSKSVLKNGIATYFGWSPLFQKPFTLTCVLLHLHLHHFWHSSAGLECLPYLCSYKFCSSTSLFVLQSLQKKDAQFYIQTHICLVLCLFFMYECVMLGTQCPQTDVMLSEKGPCLTYLCINSTCYTENTIQTICNIILCISIF